MKKMIPLLLLLWSLSPLCRAHEGGGFVADDLLATLQPGDRAALLMVHFGTSYDDTRALTLDAINAKAAAAFPQLTFAEAYTSRIIIRKLAKRGIEKQTPLNALLRLRSEGYTHVVVQSSTIIEGVEMESLRRDIESVQPFFKEIRVGTPLLYSVDDVEKVADILNEYLQPTADGGNSKGGKKAKRDFVLVGHGTYTPSTATYSQLSYILQDKGMTNFHIGTIEGHPTFDSMLKRLKAAKAKQVTLMPLMIVAGDHAKNDIAGEWKEALEKEGFATEARLEGLGQIPQIQELFIEHIRFMLTHRAVGIMEKKAGYAAGQEVK